MTDILLLFLASIIAFRCCEGNARPLLPLSTPATARNRSRYNPSVRENHDQIDFIRHWDHTRSKVGQLFCFDEMVQVDLKNDDGKVKTPVYVEDEDEEKLYQEFRALLTEEEKLIADMRWNKQMTQKEIAEALGYKSHSAVTKKLKKMREKFDTMRK